MVIGQHGNDCTADGAIILVFISHLPQALIDAEQTVFCLINKLTQARIRFDFIEGLYNAGAGDITGVVAAHAIGDRP